MNIKDRYSLWPDGGLPAVRLRVFPEATVDPQGWVYPGPTRSFAVAPEWVTCPPELHLREFSDIDPTSADDLVDLVRVAGFPLDELDLGTTDERPWTGLVSATVKPSVARSRYRTMIREVAADLGHPTPKLDARPGQAVHLTELACRVVLVQLFVDFVREELAGRSPQRVWQAAGALEVTEDDEVMWPELSTAGADEVSRARFSAHLNRGLESMSPRVSAPLPGTPRTDDVVDSFTAACTLVFNDLIERVPYRRCEDETCGRWFKHQLGRSTGKYSRTDAKVMYCTPQHARNQAQRESRRAKRAQQRGSDHGK